MRRLAVSVVVLAFAAAAPAGAITFGSADGSGHPNVGGLVAEQAYSDGTWIYCSGTLISPTVFLTAAHCEEGDRVRVTFSSAYQDGDKIYTGTWHADPAYNQSQSDPHDIAVVVFDKPVKGIAPATLPEAGSLSGLTGSQTFTSVGYGLQKSFPDAAAWKDVALRIRMLATPKLIQINVPGSVGDFSMLLSNNAHTGGTCFGDSGGPNFLGSTNLIAGVTSYGKNGTCAGTGGVFRLDRQNVLDFINGFIAAHP